MQPTYDEKKATQVASTLIELSKGSINYTLLIKLMYLVDREALLQWGRPVTFDSYVSMPKGPVLSSTLNKIKSTDLSDFWHQHISRCDQHSVCNVSLCPKDDLSDNEKKLVEEIFNKYSHMELWTELIDGHMHQLPEWQNPGGSAIPINYEDILRAGGKSETDIDLIKDELEGVMLMDELLKGV